MVALPHSEAMAQVYIFAMYVAVYSLSFFHLGKLRYVLLIPYGFLAFRILQSLIPSFQAQDHVFFSIATIALMVVALIAFNLIKHTGISFPEETRDRINLACWATSVTVISPLPIMFLKKEMNMYTSAYLLIFIILFLFTQFMDKFRPKPTLFQIIALILASTPYVLSLLVLNDIFFVRTYVIGSLVVITIAVLNLSSTYWLRKK
jgi:hypothetical protein